MAASAQVVNPIGIAYRDIADGVEPALPHVTVASGRTSNSRQAQGAQRAGLHFETFEFVSEAQHLVRDGEFAGRVGDDVAHPHPHR